MALRAGRRAVAVAEVQARLERAIKDNHASAATLPRIVSPWDGGHDSRA